MAGLAKKQNTVETIKTQMKDATIAVVADYRGLSVEELTQLRAELYKESAQFTVVKNTLMRRVVKDTDKEPLTPYLSGPTAILWGTGDQIAPVKVLKKFLTQGKKTNEIRGGLLEGKGLSAAEVEQLAKLPPFDELRGMLVSAINSPLAGIVGAISSPQRGLVNVLDQYAKTKA